LASAQQFSGHRYVMTEHFTTDTCRPQIECDCCSSDILFISDKEFVMIDRCLYNDSYYRGTYSVTKENLTLNFRQIVVKETYVEETETTKVEKRNLKIVPFRFYITNCETDDFILQRTDLKVLTKAFREKKENADGEIKELKKKDAWKQLFLHNNSNK
jgi:hypothetical protein